MDEATHKINPKHFYTNDLFMDKSPSLARWIPGFVYRFLSRIVRRFLGIKTNIEMFFLPNEPCKHRDKHFPITFGPPIPCHTFDSPYNAKEWAALAQDYTYTTKENYTLPLSVINK